MKRAVYAAICLIICSGCTTIGSAESAVKNDFMLNQSVSSDVYPLSKSVSGDVYGSHGSAKKLIPAPLEDARRPPLRK